MPVVTYTRASLSTRTGIVKGGKPLRETFHEFICSSVSTGGFHIQRDAILIALVGHKANNTDFKNQEITLLCNYKADEKKKTSLFLLPARNDVGAERWIHLITEGNVLHMRPCEVGQSQKKKNKHANFCEKEVNGAFVEETNWVTAMMKSVSRSRDLAEGYQGQPTLNSYRRWLFNGSLFRALSLASSFFFLSFLGLDVLPFISPRLSSFSFSVRLYLL